MPPDDTARPRLPEPTTAHIRAGRCTHDPPCNTGIVYDHGRNAFDADDPTSAPGSFLTDPAALEPDHICHEGMQASLFLDAVRRGLWRALWAVIREHDSATTVEGRGACAVCACALAMPRPMGRDAIAEWRAEYRDDAGPLTVPLIPALCEQRDAEAALILYRKVGDSTVRLYGLVERDLEAMTYAEMEAMTYADLEEHAAYVWADPLIQVEGPSKDATRAAERLGRWYARVLLGKRVSGRPRGSGMTPDRFLDEVASAVVRCDADGVPRTVENIGERAGYPKESMHRWRRDLTGHKKFGNLLNDPDLQRRIETARAE